MSSRSGDLDPVYMVRIEDLDAKQFNAAEAIALFCYQIKKWIGTFHVRRWAAWTHFLRR